MTLKAPRTFNLNSSYISPLIHLKLQNDSENMRQFGLAHTITSSLHLAYTCIGAGAGPGGWVTPIPRRPPHTHIHSARGKGESVGRGGGGGGGEVDQFQDSGWTGSKTRNLPYHSRTECILKILTNSEDAISCSSYFFIMSCDASKSYVYILFVTVDTAPNRPVWSCSTVSTLKTQTQ